MDLRGLPLRARAGALPGTPSLGLNWPFWSRTMLRPPVDGGVLSPGMPLVNSASTLARSLPTRFASSFVTSLNYQNEGRNPPPYEYWRRCLAEAAQIPDHERIDGRCGKFFRGLDRPQPALHIADRLYSVANVLLTVKAQSLLSETALHRPLEHQIVPMGTIYRLLNVVIRSLKQRPKPSKLTLTKAEEAGN